MTAGVQEVKRQDQKDGPGMNWRRLEGEAGSELELAGVVGCRLLTCVGVEQIDVEGVVLVDQIEGVRGDLQSEVV